jgi:AcrR family transcriptional regulator
VNIDPPTTRPQALSSVARAQVSEVQRKRMLIAAAQTVNEVGYASITVRHVLSRSGVSRRTFYDVFEDLDDCFLAVVEDAIDRTVAVISPAYESGPGWREKMRASLYALLQFIQQDPGRARLLLVDALSAGPAVLECRREVLTKLIVIVDQGRTEIKRAEEPHRLVAEGIVAAVLGILHARILEDETQQTIELLNPLMAMVVVPYLGQAAAREELERPAPKTPPSSSQPTEDHFKDLNMRVTYRTICVLGAIAQQPGASNRQVSDAAGIQNQGQISKLLTRLQGLKLIENTGRGQAGGEANAWTLTPRGNDIHRANLE